MEIYEYHKLLKHLYFEGYVDSYKDAEKLVEQLTDKEFNFLYEKVFIIPYLINEGYANDLDSAYVILENMSEGWKTNALKSIARGTGYVAGKLAKRASKSKLAQKANKFIKRTALGALGVPFIS